MYGIGKVGTTGCVLVWVSKTVVLNMAYYNLDIMFPENFQK